MKKVLVVGVILAGAMVNNIWASEWYIMDMKTYECIKQTELNPYAAKQAGLDVKDNGGGFFTVGIDGQSLFFFDSKKGCDKASKISKSKK